MKPPLRLLAAALLATGLAALSGCAALGGPDDPDKPIPPARPSPFSDGATDGGIQY